MNYNLSSRQCEIARIMTKSKASDETIRMGLYKLSESEWFAYCEKLEPILKRDDGPFDKTHLIEVINFQKFASEIGVDRATLFAVFMEWMNKNKKDISN